MNFLEVVGVIALALSTGAVGLVGAIHVGEDEYFWGAVYLVFYALVVITSYVLGYEGWLA